ncbi:DUF2188 domain-containing protein [Cupriavidus sp. H39]|uniref:DUF2188 domain-containing protein n=1 Tax=Cupriavidus sp. H39 TaxID=3401635 RepID=UPI003D07DA52
MTTITVQVRLTDDARWTVEIDGVEQYTTYPTRNAAIAAGVHMAMENDAVLMIHRVGRKNSEIDFRDYALPTSKRNRLRGRDGYRTGADLAAPQGATSENNLPG